MQLRFCACVDCACILGARFSVQGITALPTKTWVGATVCKHSKGDRDYCMTSTAVAESLCHADHKHCC
jgi:hypothetical protein